MFEGTKYQVDKLENGYGVKSGSDQMGDVRKYVFGNFNQFVRHLAKLFGEDGRDQDCVEVRHRDPRDYLRAMSPSHIVNGGEEALRDEVGELRREGERKDKKISTLEDQNAALTRSFNQLDRRYGEVTAAYEELRKKENARIEERQKAARKAGKKKPAATKKR